MWERGWKRYKRWRLVATSSLCSRISFKPEQMRHGRQHYWNVCCVRVVCLWNTSVWELVRVGAESGRYWFSFLPMEFHVSAGVWAVTSSLILILKSSNFSTISSILGQYNKADNTSVQAIFTNRTNVLSHTLHLCNPCGSFFLLTFSVSSH